MCTPHKMTSHHSTPMVALQAITMRARLRVRLVLLKARPRKWTLAETSSGVAVASPQIGPTTRAPSPHASHHHDTTHLAQSGSHKYFIIVRVTVTEQPGDEARRRARMEQQVGLGPSTRKRAGQGLAAHLFLPAHPLPLLRSVGGSTETNGRERGPKTRRAGAATAGG